MRRSYRSNSDTSSDGVVIVDDADELSDSFILEDEINSALARLDEEDASEPLALARRPATLLDLPHELLRRIGEYVAPLGGKKAASLRLVCGRIGRAVAPVVWSSILFPTLEDDREELLSHLISNRLGHQAWIFSIHYTLSAARCAIAVAVFGLLPSLERLHVEGADLELPEAFYGGFKSMKALKTLSFKNVDLVCCFNLHKLAVNVLKLQYCLNTLNVFWRTEVKGYQNLNLERLTLHTPSDFTHTPFASATHCIAFALQLHRASEQHLTFDIHWREVESCESACEIFESCPWTRKAKQPITLHLSGPHVTCLFNGQMHSRNYEPTLLVKFLNWMGGANLVELTLPTIVAVHHDTAMAHLVLPSLTVLRLSRQIKPFYEPSDLLKPGMYQTLSDFLSIKRLPSLSNLHVAGIIDRTSVSSIAGIPVDELPQSHVFLYGLLGVLRKTGIIEIRLENSAGCPGGVLQCVYERGPGEEWRSRRAKMW